MTTITTPVDPALEARARRRVGRKLGLAIHATVYLVVNAGLWLLAQATGKPWNAWVLAGWGIGLAAHAIVTALGLMGEPLRDQHVAREIQRLRRDR